MYKVDHKVYQLVQAYRSQQSTGTSNSWPVAVPEPKSRQAAVPSQQSACHAGRVPPRPHQRRGCLQQDTIKALSKVAVLSYSIDIPPEHFELDAWEMHGKPC